MVCLCVALPCLFLCLKRPEPEYLGFSVCPHHLLAGWLWQSYLTSLSFRFLIYKVKTVIPVSEILVEKISVYPILWPPDANSWLIGKDSDAGKDWSQSEKKVTEDGMVGWHHWLNGHELWQTLRDVIGQGGLACCSPRGHKESDMT